MACACRLFRRRAQDQRQCVQPRGEFVLHNRIDGAVPGHPALPFEGGGDQQNGIVRLPRRAGPGMAGMAGAVIGDVQDGRREGGLEQGFDALGAGWR